MLRWASYAEREPILLAFIRSGRFLDPKAIVTTDEKTGAGYLLDT